MELMSRIGLALVKKDMLRYVQDVRAVREMERSLSYHYVAKGKVRLVESWIKRRELVNEARRIRSEKLRE